MKKVIILSLSIFLCLFSWILLSDKVNANNNNIIAKSCYNLYATSDTISHLKSDFTVKINKNSEKINQNDVFYQENEDFSKVNQENDAISVYVVDDFKNQENEIDVNIPEDNYYFIMSSEHLSDEDVESEIDNFNYEIERTTERMHIMQEKMQQMHRMFEDIFNW